MTRGEYYEKVNKLIGGCRRLRSLDEALAEVKVKMSRKTDSTLQLLIYEEMHRTTEELKTIGNSLQYIDCVEFDDEDGEE